jgi:glycine oxidase
LELRKRGLEVTIFEKDTHGNYDSCASYYAGGMLAPFSEVDLVPPEIHPYIRQIHKEACVFYAELDALEEDGGLMFAHPLDQTLYQEFKERISRLVGQDQFRAIKASEVADLEPVLKGKCNEVLFFPNEAHLDPRKVLKRLDHKLSKQGVRSIYGVTASIEMPGCVRFKDEMQSYDLVVDCRGMGAVDDLKRLRGVTGEALIVKAPEVQLRRAIRVLHPRYPLYVVPRNNETFFVGATIVERDGREKVTVRSALELMSALVAVCPAFLEARILELISETRPALPHNEPRIAIAGKVAWINGLYRSGFLMAPWIARIFAERIFGEDDQHYARFFEI